MLASLGSHSSSVTVDSPCLDELLAVSTVTLGPAPKAPSGRLPPEGCLGVHGAA